MVFHHVEAKQQEGSASTVVPMGQLITDLKMRYRYIQYVQQLVITV